MPPLIRRLAVSAVGLLLPALAAAQPNAPAAKPGFPFDIPGQTADQAAPVGSQVMAADLGLTPGFKSIIFGLRNGRLYVVKRDSPTIWSVAAGWPEQLPAHVYSSPAVGDVDGDGDPDIVVGFGSVDTQGLAHGGLKAFDRNGTELWEVLTLDVTPGPANGFRDPVMSTPAIGDVDGDGTMEVIFGALDHRLYVVNGSNGTSNNASIWPKDMGDTVFSSPVLHDLDGIQGAEIVVGTDDFSINGGRLRVLRFNGADLAGFTNGKPIDQVVSSSPAVGDIDGDGRPEIVHGTGSFFNDGNNGPNPAPLPRVYAWNCDGTPVAGWPVAVNGQVISSPALANLDGDAPLEVVVTTSNVGATDSLFRVYAFNGNGGQIFSTVVRDFFNQSLNAGEPVVGDVLGADATVEILVPTNGEVAIFTTAGTQLTETDDFPDDLTRPNLMTQDSLTGVAVTDLETDMAGSQIEVIAVSARDFPTQTTTVVHVWNPIARTSTPPWGFFHQSPPRSGVAPGTTSCADPLGPCPPPPGTALDFFAVTPCRLVDTRNPAGPLGGPVLVSGVSRTVTLAGVCGIPVGANAVSLNVTVTQPSSLGHITFSPACIPPTGSTINFGTGQTRANNTVQPLSSDGKLTASPFVLGNGTVHVIVDVNGYFE